MTEKIKSGIIMIVCIFIFAVLAVASYTLLQGTGTVMPDSNGENTLSASKYGMPATDVITAKFKGIETSLGMVPQYRLWNETRGEWVGTGWRNVPESFNVTPAFDTYIKIMDKNICIKKMGGEYFVRQQGERKYTYMEKEELKVLINS